MKVPRRSISYLIRLLVTLVAILSLPLVSFADHVPAPRRILLEDIGFQPQNALLLLNGSSMLTLHYVDDKHLLVTFTVRRLLPRLPDEPADDQDRNIDAVLLELPTGNVLARTSWRTHDHGQYLWSLGQGHFLLRIRNTLTTFSPLDNLPSGHPFAQHPFLTAPGRRLAAILLSPDDDLMMVETVPPPTPEERHEAILGPIADPPALKTRDSVQINFYRISSDEHGVHSTLAGVAHTPHTGGIAANAAGFLATVDQGHQHWAFDFHSYTGHVDQLSPFDSTCSPVPILVSHSEFIAFGCHVGQSMHTLGGFNMRGEEMWEQNLFGEYLSPSFVFAPANGRFALSRVLTRSEFMADEPISSDLVSAQTVVVVQASSGRQLFKTDCAPIERAGQNFALSPDGLSLAVIRADAIEIYPLPPPTNKEQTAFKLAQSSAPKENDLPIRFGDESEADAEPEAQPQSQPETQPETDGPIVPTHTTSQAASQPAPASSTPDQLPALASQPAATTPTAGDAPPEAHRKPPTLYTLPTDHHGSSDSGDQSPAATDQAPK